LIDPYDFTIAAIGGDITGAALSALLVTNSVIISTDTGGTSTTAGTPPVTTHNSSTPGNGDINVNDVISWVATPSTTTLTLNAVRDVNVNQAITAVNGNVVACCGRDINVDAAITTTNGSILLGAGRNANINAALTATDGNMMICGAQDVNVNLGGAITLTNGSTIPSQSLGLNRGLVLAAGYGSTGPGTGGGTLNFAPGAPIVTVTNAPAEIFYNPVSYALPTDYSTQFNPGISLTEKMWVFPDGADKVYDGTTAANLSSLKGNPAGVTLIAGPGSTATFDTPLAGTNKIILFNGYSLGGINAGNFALASSCCAPISGRTTASITVAPPPPIPPTDTGGTIPPGGTILPDGTVIPGGSKVLPGGTIVLPDGSIIRSGGQTSTPLSPLEMVGVIPVIAPPPTLALRPSLIPSVTLAELPPELLTLMPAPVPQSIYVPRYPLPRRYLN
jgi:hypothetical protein